MAKSSSSDEAGGSEVRMRGEFRTGPVAGTMVIQGITFKQKAVQFANVDGVAMFEGDIILGSTDEILRGQGGQADAGPVLESIGITGQQFRWPNATIPYDFDAGFPNQQRVTDAIAHWQAHTRIRFVLRTAANAAQFPDWVRFVNGGGCSSSVGKRGGMQVITLGPNCGTGNAIHEIGHTVGLWHEQSREDRDTFVRIVWANIDPAMQHNFDQHIADGDDLGAYDYGSIMHYPPNAFSTNGQPTIVALQPIPAGVVMGQRTGLSAGDIAGVAAMYPGVSTFKEVPKDPIFDTTRKEVAKDPIKDPIKDVHKDPVTDPTIKEAHKDPLTDPTIKETHKDPISDPTHKELTKDPIFDGTLKEAAGDPGGGGGTLVETIGRPHIPGVPFVMAEPSNFGAQSPAASPDLSSQVQALGQAIVAIQQQLAQVAAAHDALVQSLGGQQG